MTKFEKCSFELPTRIEFEIGARKRAGEEVKRSKSTRVLLVTDKGVLAAGLAESVEASLKKEGVSYVLYDEICPNPKDHEIMKAADFAKQEGIDGIVALGGGSVIDAAKAIGVLLTHGGHILDWCGIFLLKKRILPLIAIPTTAGTGSEVTCFAVVTNTEKMIKESVWDLKAGASVALLDPEVLMGVPSHIMASTGVDALTHAIEAYTCKSATPYSDVFAMRAISLVFKNLEKAVEKADPDNCSAMMLGCNFAGLAIGYGDVAGVHCIAEALGGKYDIPHGVANAMLLPTVTRYNCLSNTHKYANAAQLMGADINDLKEADAALMCADMLESLCRTIGIKKMRDFAIIQPVDFPELAQSAQNNTSTPSNPAEMSEATYLQLINEAYLK